MNVAGSLLDRAKTWLEQTWRQAPPSLRRHWPWFILGGLVAGFLVVFLLRPSADEPPSGGGADPTVAAAGAPGQAPPSHGGNAGEASSGPVVPPLAPSAMADAGPPLSPNVKITFRTVPLRRASVMWGAKRLIWWLYDVHPTDVWALAASELVLLLVAFLTCLMPARRAMRADPAEILRAV